jgi:hypothetical protein
MSNDIEGTRKDFEMLRCEKWQCWRDEVVVSQIREEVPYAPGYETDTNCRFPL